MKFFRFIKRIRWARALRALKYAIIILAVFLAACEAPVQPRPTPGPAPTNGPAAAPIFDPGSGNVAPDEILTIRSETDGATIYYTTDGTDPAPSSDSGPSPLMRPFSRFGMGEITIRAFAAKTGYENSGTTEASFTVQPVVAAPRLNVEGANLAVDQELLITSDGATIHYTTDETDPVSSETRSSGPSPLQVEFPSDFDTVGESFLLRAIAERDNHVTVALEDMTFTARERAVSPSFDLDPTDGEVNTLRHLIITNTTPNANIYYTTDGTDPRSSETRRVGISPLSVSFNTPGRTEEVTEVTIQAFAVSPEHAYSIITNEDFMVRQSPTVATPSFIPADGALTIAETLTISAATGDDSAATIYYTMDGSEPNIDGSPSTASASSPVVLDLSDGNSFTPGDYVIKAVATATGHHSSASSTRSFELRGATRVATPGFNPATGDLTTVDTLTISRAGATIYYTTDGSEPNVDGSSSTTSASSPVELDLSDSSFTLGDYVIRAIAVREGFGNSDEGSRTFELTQAPTVGDLTFSASGGASDRSAVSTLDTLTISTETRDAVISYSIGEDSSTYDTALSFDELVSLSTAGTSATILITASATKEGYHPSTKSQTFTITKAETATAPSFSPNGGNANTLQSLTITSEEGATIYYSTDGSDLVTTGDPRSSFGTSALTLNFNTIGTGQKTIKAIAVKAGSHDSAEVSRTFTVTPAPTAATPGFNPATGDLTTVDTLTISSAGATIYYTTDRSEPNLDGSRSTTSASSSVVLDLSTSSFTPGDYVIRAIAVREGFVNSDEGSRTFELTQAPTVGEPVFKIDGATVTDENVNTTESLTISTETEGAAISYSIGGGSSTAYNTALNFDELVSLSTAGTSTTITITASATRDGYHPSTKSQRFTVTKAETVGDLTFSASGGASGRSAVSSLDTLTISTVPNDAVISYSIGGGSSTTYNTALSFDELVSLSTAGTSATITITASATKDDYHSSTKSQTFTVTKAPTATAPSFSPDGGPTTTARSLTITSEGSRDSLHNGWGNTPDNCEPFNHLTTNLEL